jgi:hypothetical protein
MPYSYVVDATRHLVLSRYSGLVTEADARAKIAAIAADPAFRPDMRELCDARDTIAVQIPGDVVRALPRCFGPGARRAFVATSPAVYGSARQYEVSQDREETIRAFSSMDEALDWLGLNPERDAILARLAALAAFDRDASH